MIEGKSGPPAASRGSMLRRKMRLALVAFVALVSAPAHAAAGVAPDVALTVRVHEDDRLVASESTQGRFGESLVVRTEGLMQVEFVVDPPDAEGYSRMRIAVTARKEGTLQRTLEHEFELALEGTRTDFCDAPNFTHAVRGTGLRFCVMPRVGVAPVPVKPGQWPAVTRASLDRLRTLITEVHPGAIVDDDPAFRHWLDEGHRQARVLAAKVRTKAEHAGVMRYYVAGFRDGHLALDGPWAYTVRWAGWIARLDDSRLVVAHAQPAWPVPLPPLGATVLECDGRPPLDLLIRDVAPWVDRRTDLLQVRQQLAHHLTVDEGGLPGRRMPARCTVEMPGGGERTFSLRWQTINAVALTGLMRGTARAPRQATFAVEDLGAGRHWVRVPTFDVGADGLRQIDGVAAQLATLAGAKLVVFDLRGNGGGNSALGERLFDALTGGLEATPGQLARVPHARALWRVSSRTIAQLERTARAKRAEGGPDHPSAKFSEEYAARMRFALAEGKPWVEQPGGAALTPALVRESGIKPRHFTGRIAVVTDASCFSACLDFMDSLVLVPGTTHLGLTTGADTRYIDVGEYRVATQTLAVVPRKVWLGRARGNNEPHVPSRMFTGNIADDAAVRAWVLSALESKTTL